MKYHSKRKSYVLVYILAIKHVVPVPDFLGIESIALRIQIMDGI